MAFWNFLWQQKEAQWKNELNEIYTVAEMV